MEPTSLANITIDDVKGNIEKFNFRKWVWMVFCPERDINGISNGSEIYERVFEPVLFDTKSVARHNFLEFIGYWKLMKTLSVEETDREKISEIDRDIFNTIKERLEPLYVGNFEYGAPIPASTRDSTWPSVELSSVEISQVFKWRLRIRSNFKKSLKSNGLTLEQGYKIIEENTGEKNIALAKEIALQHIAKAAQDRKQRLHQQRTDVSRVIMRADLPCDLVPLVCAYAVPESKTYDYMQ